MLSFSRQFESQLSLLHASSAKALEVLSQFWIVIPGPENTSQISTAYSLNSGEAHALSCACFSKTRYDILKTNHFL